MDILEEKQTDLYKDIQMRTGGEIYIGVVGPVRTGKSTFIKRFMQQMVLPAIEDEEERKRAIDELPQSSDGKTIMTTEPKFIPKEAPLIELEEGTFAKIRLIDCVGFLVEGATGHMEEEKERMVHTPWFTEEIPFAKAAEIGTKKVIHEHSTVGIIVMTDGTIGELPKENYREAEEKSVAELKAIGKPYIILLNSTKPFAKETQEYRQELEEKYGSPVLAVNCEQLRKSDIQKIVEELLYEFPLTRLEIFLPKWTLFLPREHEMKAGLATQLKKYMADYQNVRDFMEHPLCLEGDYIANCRLNNIDLATGIATVNLEMENSCYYKFLSELSGEEITGDDQIILKLKKANQISQEYDRTREAFAKAQSEGYGVVLPEKEEIILKEPELIKQGNKYGVKIHASSPSIHMIKANIETEIAPIVGTESQAQDLISFLHESGMEGEGIWQTNIFGKNVEQLVFDGIRSKVQSVDRNCQDKLQNSMKKIVNDASGGIICIIL